MKMKKNDMNFCKINYNLSLYTHIGRIYAYTVNVYKEIVQAMFERLINKNIQMDKNLFHPTIYIYIRMWVYLPG